MSEHRQSIASYLRRVRSLLRDRAETRSFADLLPRERLEQLQAAILRRAAALHATIEADAIDDPRD
jgi:hypothetical protein